MNILSNIAAHKRLEVAERRVLYPVTHLVQSRLFNRATLSMTEYLQCEGASGIIAEFKTRKAEIRRVNYEFQRGGNELLIIK